MSRPSLLKILGNGLRCRCPACGNAAVFESGYKLNEFCPVCGLAIRSRDPDTWFFMYGSTAAITGVFILLLFALRPVGRPDLVRVLLVGGAIVTFLTTMPARKSLAVAFDYWLEARS